MSRTTKPLIDPSTGRPTKAFPLFHKTCAALCLQRFYRHFIKWERDEDGQPIDPILKDGFDRKNQVRILYKSKLGDKYVTRIQLYDIETLWESINHSHQGETLAINPITNTPFAENQFRCILEKATQFGLIAENQIENQLQKFGYKNGFIHNSQKSAYEPEDIEIQKHKVQKNRANHLLAYFALINDFPRVERIIYKHMSEIGTGTFNINFIRKIGQKLPVSISPEKDTDQKGIVQLLNALSPYFYEPKYNQETSTSLNPIIKPILSSNKESNVSETKKIIEIDPEIDESFQIDLELEKTSLPDYLKQYNAIQACCLRGNHEMLMFLMQFGGDLEVKDPLTNVLPIHIVLMEKHLDLIQMLILYGAGEQLESTSQFGTPLELANNCLEEIPHIYSLLFGSDSF